MERTTYGPPTDAPGCLPGLRPDLVRDDRFFAGFLTHGASDGRRTR